jgi:hypothetical protein
MALCVTSLVAAPGLAADEQAGGGPFEVPPGSGRIEEFLGCEFADGSTRQHPVTRAEMPWRVAIGMPHSSPKYGSRQQARDAAVDSMRLWERSIQTRVPWFELEFVEKDTDAPIQIDWKRRITGKAAGRAAPVCRVRGESVRAGGRMDIAVQSCPTCRPLTVDEIRYLVAHEFGHILNLGHCLDCDSAMNYSWHTQGRVFVTETDVIAVAGLIGEETGSGEREPSDAPYLVEGEILSFDPAGRVLKVRVTGTEPGRFSQLSIYGLSNAGSRSIEAAVGTELHLAVTTDGSVMERTTIRAAHGGGIDTHGTAAGFAEAVAELREGASAIFVLWEEGDLEGGSQGPDFRVRTILLATEGGARH